MASSVYVEGVNEKISGEKYCDTCNHEAHSMHNNYGACLREGCDCTDVNNESVAP